MVGIFTHLVGCKVVWHQGQFRACSFASKDGQIIWHVHIMQLHHAAMALQGHSCSNFAELFDHSIRTVLSLEAVIEGTLTENTTVVGSICLT